MKFLVKFNMETIGDLMFDGLRLGGKLILIQLKLR